MFSKVSEGCEHTVWHSIAALLVAGMVHEPESSPSVVILPRPTQNLTVSDYRLVTLNEASGIPWPQKEAHGEGMFIPRSFSSSFGINLNLDLSPAV